MKGKDKCKILKEIRAQIAAANDVAWVTENCTHKGECRGTCPKCEAEVLTLERALERRRAMGKRIAVVGLSAGILATATACSDPSGIEYTPPVGQESDDTIGIATGDIEPDYVFPGVPVLAFYTTDFTACEPVSYVTANSMGIEHHLQDFAYTDESVWEIPAGEMIAVIGVSDEQGAVLISYGGQQFVLWADCLDALQPVTAPDTVESVEPTDPA